jgi:hypothetical protein
VVSRLGSSSSDSYGPERSSSPHSDFADLKRPYSPNQHPTISSSTEKSCSRHINPLVGEWVGDDELLNLKVIWSPLKTGNSSFLPLHPPSWCWLAVGDDENHFRWGEVSRLGSSVLSLFVRFAWPLEEFPLFTLTLLKT